METPPAMNVSITPEADPAGMSPGVARRDLIAGLLAIIIGVGYLAVIDWQVSPETDGLDGVSGRTLPYLIGALLALPGVALTGQALLRKGATSVSGDGAQERARWRRAALMVGLVACYWLGVTYIGYVVATALALFSAMLFSGARNWLTMLLLVIVVPPLMYWVFHELMYIPLPEALLF